MSTVKATENKELAEEMGRRGRKYVVESRRCESIVQRVFEMCQEMMQ